MKNDVASPRKAKSALDKAIQINRHRLRQNEKRQQQLARQLKTLDSLQTIVEGLAVKLAPYRDEDVVRIVPENDAHAGTIAQLFPAKTRLTTKGDALRRLERYGETLRLRRAGLESQLKEVDHYHAVLVEAHSVTSQLRQLKKQKRAATEARKKARKRMIQAHRKTGAKTRDL